MPNAALLAPLDAVFAATSLDAVILVPGANFRRVTGVDFHQMERPLALIVPRKGEAVAIVPHLELGSFTPIGFPGEVFFWRDEDGYMGAFMQAGAAMLLEAFRQQRIHGFHRFAHRIGLMVDEALGDALEGHFRLFGLIKLD